MDSGVIVLIVIGLGFVLMLFLKSKQDDKVMAVQNKQAEYDKEHPEEVIERQYNENYVSGTVISGHPDISTPCWTNIKVSRTDVIIHEIGGNNTLGKEIGRIPLAQIKSAKVEDKSTIEKRVTAGRIILLGVFALAAKKAEKHEDYYLVVSWGDGRFDFDTIFELTGGEGNSAHEAANKACNIIIKRCREQTAIIPQVALNPV